MFNDKTTTSYLGVYNLNWTKERLDEIETSIVNNPHIDKAVVQQVLMDCVEEIRRLYGHIVGSKLIGKKIKIIGNTNAHEFVIGDIVQIVEFDEFDPSDEESGVEAAPLNGGEHWFVRHGDYLLLAE